MPHPSLANARRRAVFVWASLSAVAGACGDDASSDASRADAAASERDASVWVPAPDGAMSAADGAMPAPDGAMPAPDGAMSAADGAMSAADGAMSAADGAMSAADGAMPAPDAGASVSYLNDVRPIFLRACVVCHRAGSIIDLDLTNPFDPDHGIIDRVNSWAEVHESPFAFVVKPGSPDDSFLLYKVEADPNPDKFDIANNGDPMPMQIPRVTDGELADIKQWIRDGANNDAFFTDRVAPVFGTEITLGRKRGKCTFCHYPGSPTGLDILAVFDTKLGLVGADSLLSTKPRVDPGAPENSFLVEKIEQAQPSAGAQMPLHPERLSKADVETLRRWIAQGATQN